ncbi:hypothetical protein RRG08_019068 [Elysia crispata]|uniref:Uncharacterized protein n=1 Tax=Elysia crispata TaxID=231223 RepID=A0AAE1A5P9_9GAST|nr:hypothetical protein RRG08_019068 [Elysia crispata]
MPPTDNDNSSLGNECKKLKKTNEVLLSKNSEKDLQISILKEERNDLKYENEKLHDIQNLLDLNLEQNRALTRQLKEKEIELDKGKKSRTYKLNVTLKKKIKEALDKIDVLNAENEELKTKLDSILESLSVHGLSKVECAVPVFEDFLVDEAVKNSLATSTCIDDVLMSTLKKIAKKRQDVLKRQLCDFLEGGIFGSHIDQETQYILNTCPLTNLSGERLFGDMDYNQLRRRHGSTHHRSTVIMWKHNNTAKWLLNKSNGERSKIMDSTIKHGKELRQKHLESVKKVNEEIKAKLLDTEKKMKEREI